MRIWKNALTVIRDHGRTYLLLNLAVYGALAASAVLTLLLPGLRERGAQDVETFGSVPILSLVTDAYTDGDVLAAAVGTFLANLLFAAVLTTTLPSQVCDQRSAVHLPDAVPSGALRLVVWDQPWWPLPPVPFDLAPEQTDAGELPQTRGPPLPAPTTV